MQTTSANNSNDLVSQAASWLRRIDLVQLVLVLILLALALVVWAQARQRLVTPIDSVVTERLCTDHGEEIGRESTGYERSNRFGLFNRSEGFCSYGDGPDGEAPMTLTIEQTQPGPLYRGAKIIGIILQLGIVSIFLRLIIDPVLDAYRQIKARFFA